MARKQKDAYLDEVAKAQDAYELEQKKAYVAALEREKGFYEANGNKEGVEAVDAELKRLAPDRARVTPRRERAVAGENENAGGGDAS